MAQASVAAAETKAREEAEKKEKREELKAEIGAVSPTKKTDKPEKGEKQKKGGKEKKLEDILTEVGHEWLRSVIRYAPHIEMHVDLFKGSFKKHGMIVYNELSDWIGNVHWSKNSEVDTLIGLVKSVDALRCPPIAAGLLENSSTPEYLTDKLMELTRLCVASPSHATEGMLHRVESAAKKFIRRIHSEAYVEYPPEPKEKELSDWIKVNGVWNQKPKKKKEKLPAKELEVLRLKTLRDCCKVLDQLFYIPEFGEKPAGLLFEFGRCSFFRGEATLVLASLCQLGKEQKSFTSYRPALSEFLTEKGTSILQEEAPLALQNPNALLALLKVVDDTLDKKSELAGTFLYSLVVSTGVEMPPDLLPVLRYASMWERVFKSRGMTEAALKASDSPLQRLLLQVFQLLHKTAGQVADGTAPLKVLHTVLENRTNFLKLLKLLQNKSLNSKKLSEQEKKLRQFDQDLQEVKCYVKSFCNCGVKIDSAELATLVRRLQKQYDTLKLVEVADTFTGLKKKMGTTISWLY